MANQSQERWDHAVLEHEEILRKLTARDGPALGDLLRRHLANKLEVVTATIEASAIAPKHRDEPFGRHARDEQTIDDVNGAAVKA